jgi:hypothetical protein
MTSSMSGLPFECETSAGAHALDPGGGSYPHLCYVHAEPHQTSAPRPIDLRPPSSIIESTRQTIHLMKKTTFSLAAAVLNEQRTTQSIHGNSATT